MKLSMIRKALMGAAAAALTATITAWPDGLTNGEIATIITAAGAAGLAVFGIPNEPQVPNRPQVPNEPTGE